MVARLERTGRVLRLTAAPFAERAGPGPVVMLVEDVTEQRTLEAQLIQNDKMASIGQLVSGVAHELNNPLTSIAGLTELLLERELHPDFPREHLRVIHDQAERAGRIVRNLLTFARKGVPEKAAVDLNDVAARTSLLIVYELQLHGIELEQALSPDAGRRPGRPLRAAAGAAQPDHQRGAGGERSAAGPTAEITIVTAAGRAARRCSACATPAPACRRSTRRTSSPRSSPPRRPARAPGWGCRSATAW